MMRRRSEKALSAEDIALWAHVAGSVMAYEGRKVPHPPPAPPTIVPPVMPKGQPAPAMPPKALPPPTMKPLAPIERRMLSALKHGRSPIEGVLDLHGLRQDEAHDRLRAFVRRRQQSGARLVLVITGKGAPDADPISGERGVLKRLTPLWLRQPDLRSVVLGFADASQGHGGAGALYVRLRRPGDEPIAHR